MVWEAGAVPVVVLNKADLSADPEGDAASLRAPACRSSTSSTISALDEAGPKACATETTTTATSDNTRRCLDDRQCGNGTSVAAAL